MAMGGGGGGVGGNGGDGGGCVWVYWAKTKVPKPVVVHVKVP